MDSVTLTKADAPRIIAQVASSLAGILHLLRHPARPRKVFGIWRLWQDTVEDELRTLAMHPDLSSQSRRTLEHGFRAASRQIDRMQKDAHRFASRPDAVPSPAVRTENLARNTQAAQMLRNRLDHMRHELDEYYAAIALSRDFTIAGSGTRARRAASAVASEDSIPPHKQGLVTQ